MAKKLRFYFTRNEIGQILDALYERRDSWKVTYQYLTDGYVEDCYIIEECSSAHEAAQIAKFYDELITSIETQLTRYQAKR